MRSSAMSSYVYAALLVAALGACGGDDSRSDLLPAALDLSAAVDLASIDLAHPQDMERACNSPPRDLSHGDLAWNMCAGTPIAGTCIATLFDSFAACFTPAGHCSAGEHNLGNAASWANGARYVDGLGTGYEYALYTMNMGATSCLGVYSEFGTPSEPTQFCGPTDSCSHEHNFDAGSYVFSGGALYDPASGIFTCNDGTQVMIGPTLDTCPALAALLNAQNTLCDACYL